MRPFELDSGFIEPMRRARCAMNLDELVFHEALAEVDAFLE
jgi:hypothetical protein